MFFLSEYITLALAFLGSGPATWLCLVKCSVNTFLNPHVIYLFFRTHLPYQFFQLNFLIFLIINWRDASIIFWRIKGIPWLNFIRYWSLHFFILIFCWNLVEIIFYWNLKSYIFIVFVMPFLLIFVVFDFWITSIIFDFEFFGCCFLVFLVL